MPVDLDQLRALRAAIAERFVAAQHQADAILGQAAASADADFRAMIDAVVPPPPPDVPGPTSIVATDGNAQVTVRWAVPAGLDSLLIQYNEGEAPQFAPVDGQDYAVGGHQVDGGDILVAGAVAEYHDVDLTNGQAYTYKLWSRDPQSGRYSTGSLAVTAHPRLPDPVTPPPPASDECPECDWAEAIIAAADPKDVLLVDGTSYTFKAGANNHKYFWARNGAAIWFEPGAILNTHLGVVHDSSLNAGLSDDAPSAFNVVFTGAIDPATDPHQIGGQVLVHNSKVRIYGKPVAPKADGFPDYGTQDRSIVFRSADPKNNLARGCLMLMTNDVVIRYAAFIDMGRQDKSRPVTDFPNTDNLRGRYVIHFHKAGFDGQADITGCVCLRSPGWQFVNHLSHVVFTQCLSVDAYGAAFVTEIGGELGALVNCAAYNVRGTSGISEIDGTRNGTTTEDFGIMGHGFWGMSGGPFAIRGLVVNGCNGHAVARVNINPVYVPTRYLTGDDYAPTAAWVTDPGNQWHWSFKLYPPDAIPGGMVPFFDRGIHVTDCNGLGVFYWAINNPSDNGLRSLLADSTFEGCVLMNGYTNFLDFINVELNGDPSAPGDRAIGHTGSVESCNYINCRIKNHRVGIQAPSRGDSTIRGCTFACACDILILNQSNPYIYAGKGPTRTLTITGNTHEAPAFDLKAFPVVVSGGTAVWLPTKKMRYAFVKKFVWGDVDNDKALPLGSPTTNDKLASYSAAFGEDAIAAPHPTDPTKTVYLLAAEQCREWPITDYPAIPAKYRDASTAGELYDAFKIGLYGETPVANALDYPDAYCKYADAPAHVNADFKTFDLA